MDAYYKVRFHPTAEELGLPAGREFVFPGFFLAWLAQAGHLSQEFNEMVSTDGVMSREETGPALLSRIDGIISRPMLTDEGAQFASVYFDLMNGGQYLRDYEQTFGVRGMPNELYSVEDTWKNYDALEPRITSAYRRWKDA